MTDNILQTIPAMDDKTLVERLRDHRVILKSGDYDGAQLMRAWCDMINAADTIEAQATRIEALEAALRIEIWNGLKRNGMSDDAATAMVKERMAALESQP